MKILLSLVTTLAALGQSFDVTLTGLVTDPTGIVVTGAAVRATNTQTGFSRSSLTGDNGRFAVLNLPAGNYKVEVFKQGFARQIRQDQVFFVGTTISLDFSLQIATLAESVAVSGDTPVLEITKNVLSRTIEYSELDKLPVITRNFAELAALAPGVVRLTTSTVAISGNRYFQNGYQVDGVSAKKDLDGTQRVQYAQDWIQEFQVMTAQFNAEFGQASGGVLNAITRSGTNTLHGRVYSFLRSDAWQAIPEFTTTKPPYDEKRIGGTIGGPLRKDRIFYFTGYEWFKNESSNIVNTAFPVLNGPVPNESAQHLSLAKLDFHPSEAHTFHLRYNTQVSDDTNTGVGIFNTQETGGPNALRASDYTANWTALLSPSAVNDVRLAFASLTSRRGCNYAQNHPDGTWFARIYSTASLGCPANQASVLFGGTGEDQVQILENYSRVVGLHEWKAGTQIHRNRFYADYAQPGSYQFGNASFPFDLANPSSYPIGFTITQGGNRYDVNSWSYGFFVQDSWRLHPNFTLNLGLRYDVDLSFSALNSLVPRQKGLHGIDTDWNNAAPRVGFTWTPLGGQRRTVIRGGAGLYYDQNHDLTATGFLQAGYLFDRSLAINANNPLLNPFGDIARARSFLAQAFAQNRIPDISSLSGVPFLLAQPDQELGIPYTVQASAGFGHQFRRGLSFTADYVHSSSLDQYLARDVNVDPVTFKPINSAYSQILAYGNAGFIRYHGLQTQITWTPSVLYLLKLSYTLSNTRSNTSTLLNGPPATNPFDFSEDEGPHDNDVRHVLSANGSVVLPWKVEIAGILRASSAPPYSAISIAPRPDGKPFTFFWRPESRNARRQDSYVSMDVRAGKTVRFGERVGITGFAEVFNLTNTVNYSAYNGTVGSPTFGRPVAASPKRRMQLGFRLDF